MVAFHEIISVAKPSLTGEDALAVILDIFFLEQTWRCYPAKDHPQLIHYFLNGHAKTLGLGGGEILAIAPIDTLRYHSEDGIFAGLTITGGVFLNGAVFRTSTPAHAHEDLLFVAEPTALLWNYPGDGYVVFAHHFPPAHVTNRPEAEPS
jgi:hypothetical protein